MKKLNVRLLAILVGTGLVLMIGFYTVNRFQVRRYSKFDLEKARELSPQKDPEQRVKAMECYLRYLQWHPKETDVRAELGLLLADLAETDAYFRGRAFLSLEQVLRENTMRDDIRRKVVDLAMQMGQFDDARDHIEVLQNRSPNDGKLHELLAQCQLAGKEYTTARRSYETAISLSPDLLDAYTGLANLVRYHADEMSLTPVGDKDKTANEDTAQNADAKTDDAKNDAQSGDTKNDAANDQATTNGDVTNNVAKNDSTNNSSPKDGPAKDNAPKTVADNEENTPDYWINKMVERNPKSAKAYRLRGEYFRSTNRIDEAQKDATAALELAPDDENTLLMAAQIAIDTRDYEQARQHAQHTVELFPASPKGYQMLSTIEIRCEDPGRAREWIDQGLLATGGDPTLLWEKANLLISEGDLEPVRPLIEQLANSHSVLANPVLLSYLEGRLAFAQKEWAKACGFFEQSRADLDRYSHGMARQATLNLYECYKKLNREEMARSLGREIQQGRRTRPATGDEAWRQLAASGQLPQAIAQCRKLLERPDAPSELRIELAKLLIVYNERLPQSERNWTEAEATVKEVAELLPDSPELPLLQAKLLLDQRRLGETRDLLEKAVQKDPTRWELWDPLVILAQTDKDYDRAAKLLDEAEKHVAAKTSIYLARARLAVLRDGEKASDELKQLGEKAATMTESEQIFFWRMMAAFCLRAKDFEQAKGYCQQAADKDPTNLQIRVLLFEIARQVRDEAAMRQVVDEIGKIEQKGPLWHYYTAQVLVLFNEKEDKNENLQQAIKHLNQARLARPEWADVPMLLAKIQDQMGDKDTAIENYLQAIELGSGDVIGMGEAANLLYREGRHDEANLIVATLERAKADIPTSVRGRRGVLRIMAKDVAGAEADFLIVADELRKRAEESQNAQQYQGLARILRTLAQIARHGKRDTEANERFDEAEKSLRQAIQLSPQDSALWIDLVVLMADAGRASDVSDVLDEAKGKLPPEEVAMTLAKCYEVLGRSAEAEVQYEKASEDVKENKDLARLMARFFLRLDDKQKRKRAEEILREMIDGKRPTNEADVPWAKRQLAAILAGRGDHQSYHDALALIEANLQANPQSVLDRRLKARLLARRPSRTDRKQAQTIFQKLVRLPKPSPDDRYQLARLLFADEQWNQASQQMLPLLASDNIRPEWLDFYIRALIRAGEYDAAEARLGRYETMIRDPFPIAVMRARILSGRKRHDQAIRILKDYVDNPSPVGSTRPTRLRQTAQALENLAKHVIGPGRDAATEQYLKQAEIYLREYVQRDPAETRLLVSFLGKYGQREEALRIAEEAWNKDQPVPIAINAVGLLIPGDPSPGEIQRVEKILSEAIDKHGEKTDLLLAMAELRSIQKRYDEVETIYRDVLAKKPKNIVALNNLAVFLSLRGLKLDESLQMMDRAIELLGPVATLLDSRATVHLAKGDWQKSLDDLSMALSEEPTGVRYFHQAQAYALGDQQREAAAAMRTADSYGLKAEQLQPLERPAYRKLKENLQ